jgi:hypothetical protein
VSGDDRTADLAQSERNSAACCAIELEIAAAHAGSLDLDDNLARSRNRIGKFRELQFALAEERYAAHCLSRRRRRTGT